MDTVKEKKSNKMEKWEIDQKINTLIEAEEIKADRKIMSQIMPRLEGKLQRIKSLEDLLEAKKDVDAKDDEFEEQTMAGGARPKKRDEWQGEEPVLALRDYLVTPDFQVVPKTPWQELSPGVREETNQFIQDEAERLRKQFPSGAVLDYLNNEATSDEDFIRQRELQRQQNIQKASEEGRIAQVLSGRAPAATVGGTSVPIDPKRPMWNKKPLLNGGQNLGDEKERTEYFNDFGWADDSDKSYWMRNKLEDIRAEERKRLKLKK